MHWRQFSFVISSPYVDTLMTRLVSSSFTMRFLFSTKDIDIEAMSMLRQIIAELEALLTCGQCHRVMSSTAELIIIVDGDGDGDGDGDDAVLRCLACYAKATTTTTTPKNQQQEQQQQQHQQQQSLSTIFVSVNGPNIYDPSAQDAGCVVLILKALLKKLEREREQERTMENASPIENVGALQQEQPGTISDNDRAPPPPSSSVPAASSSGSSTEWCRISGGGDNSSWMITRTKPSSGVLPWEQPGPRNYDSLDPEYLGPADGGVVGAGEDHSTRAASSCWYRINQDGQWEGFGGTKREWRKMMSHRRGEKTNGGREEESEAAKGSLSSSKRLKTDAFDFDDELEQQQQHQQEEDYDSQQNASMPNALTAGEQTGGLESSTALLFSHKEAEEQETPVPISRRPTRRRWERRYAHPQEQQKDLQAGQQHDYSGTSDERTKDDSTPTSPRELLPTETEDFEASYPRPPAAKTSNSSRSSEPELSQSKFTKCCGTSSSQSPPTQTPQDHDHSMDEESSNDLPETADFERIFPRPSPLEFSPSEEPTGMHRESQQQSSEKDPRVASENNQRGHHQSLLDRENSRNDSTQTSRSLYPLRQHDDQQQFSVGNSMDESSANELPETADFERIFPRPPPLEFSPSEEQTVMHCESQQQSSENDPRVASENNQRGHHQSLLDRENSRNDSTQTSRSLYPLRQHDDQQQFSVGNSMDESSANELPETAAFERIFPRPPTLEFTPSEEQTVMHCERQQRSSEKALGVASENNHRDHQSSSEHEALRVDLFNQPRRSLCPLPQHDEQQFSVRNSMDESENHLPETADFEKILPRPPPKSEERTILLDDGIHSDSETENSPSRRTDTKSLGGDNSNRSMQDDRTTSTTGEGSRRPIEQEESTKGRSSEETELFRDLSPLTESYAWKSTGNSQNSSSANEAASMKVRMSFVTPAMHLTTTPHSFQKIETQVETPFQTTMSGPPLITPLAGSDVKGTSNREKPDDMEIGTPDVASLDGTATVTLPCQSLTHPFDKWASQSVHLCARTFHYVLARADSRTIQATNGEPVWGDSLLYEQTLAALEDPKNEKAWIRDAPWWSQRTRSKCARTQKSLLASHKILVVSKEMLKTLPKTKSCVDFSNVAYTSRDFTSRNLGLEFDSIASDEMKTLCRATGAMLMDSVPHGRTVEPLLVLIPEEIDDELFTDQLLPTLVQKGIIPEKSQFRANQSGLDNSRTSNCTVSVVYYSWLVESIVADMVAPISPFCLGSFTIDE